VTEEQLFTEVQGIMQDLFEVPASELTRSSSPQTIEAWDSLQHLNLVLALEQAFSVEFAPEEMEKLVSVEAILHALTKKLQ